MKFKKIEEPGYEKLPERTLVSCPRSRWAAAADKEKHDRPLEPPSPQSSPPRRGEEVMGNPWNFPAPEETLWNNYYHDRGTGAKAIFSDIGRRLIFADMGEISRKGRMIDPLWPSLMINLFIKVNE